MTRPGLHAALALAGAFAAATFAPAAFAHAYPTSTQPADNSTATTAPTEVAIEFDDELEPRFSAIVVEDAHGTHVENGHAHVAKDDPKHLAVGLKPLGAGTYTVLWHATDTDTHQTHGQFRFTVKP